jgi:hypothetical protein
MPQTIASEFNTAARSITANEQKKNDDRAEIK